jgi:hypothetical protein
MTTATTKQKAAARKNVRKAQSVWRGMTHRQRALAQPQGRARAKPGAGGGGKYFHVAVRSKRGFSSFRTQDVGRPGHAQRVAGHRPSGGWATVKWLISKHDAHREGARLVADTKTALDVLSKLGSAPHHVAGDRFKAKPRPNVPETAKPTPAQRRARAANIKRAQAARRAKR